ncbi:tRNA pseudouridine(38-40) synthase TruA [Betaproteobacteria bacterium SCN2]|jgi:tRNA pseudouridine38-40 synthase|nr:tRNA pseudouridine(38-40) synthase TruA [Betaproteobacteria bacterium SCN2]
MRIAIGLEYDGRGFCGWQSQPSGCGIQDHLEKAVAEIAGEKLAVTAAGRTDTGVHASLQVAHFDVAAARPITAWVRGVNTHLPDGVAVLWAREVADDFHARFAVEERGYRYVLLNHPVRPGLMAGKLGWHHRPLEAEAMQAAAERLLGRHDFSAFRAAECQARSPEKELRQASINRQGDFLLCDFHADGFLHHMVRNIMGCLVHVGAGQAGPEWMDELLAHKDRTRAAPTFMADGLYLSHIRYPSRFELPESGRNPWPCA